MINQIVIVAQRSVELDLALDALDDLRRKVRLFSLPSEAATTLLSQTGVAQALPIGVVFIEVGDAIPGVANLVAGLRSEPETALIPIVIWGPAEAYRELDLANGLRANSYVQTVADPVGTASVLTQAIHYWAVVNRPPDSPLISLDIDKGA